MICLDRTQNIFFTISTHDKNERLYNFANDATHFWSTLQENSLSKTCSSLFTDLQRKAHLQHGPWWSGIMTRSPSSMACLPFQSARLLTLSISPPQLRASVGGNTPQVLCISPYPPHSSLSLHSVPSLIPFSRFLALIPFITLPLFFSKFAIAISLRSHSATLPLLSTSRSPSLYL